VPADPGVLLQPGTDPDVLMSGVVVAHNVQRGSGAGGGDFLEELPKLQASVTVPAATSRAANRQVTPCRA